MQEKQVTIASKHLNSRNRSLSSPPKIPSSRKAPIPARSASRSLHAQAQDRLSQSRGGAPDSRSHGRTPTFPGGSDAGSEADSACGKVINEIYIDDKVKDYIVDIVCATRDASKYKIQLKASFNSAHPARHHRPDPRAKAYAFCVAGLRHAQDVKSIGMDVLRHRSPSLTSRSRGKDQRDDRPKNLRRAAVP